MFGFSPRLPSPTLLKKNEQPSHGDIIVNEKLILHGSISKVCVSVSLARCATATSKRLDVAKHGPKMLLHGELGRQITQHLPSSEDKNLWLQVWKKKIRSGAKSCAWGCRLMSHTCSSESAIITAKLFEDFQHPRAKQGQERSSLGKQGSLNNTSSMMSQRLVSEGVHSVSFSPRMDFHLLKYVSAG